MKNETNKKPTGKKQPKKTKQPKGLWAKVMAVQQGVQVVAKLGNNDFHKYSYTKERDLIAEIKPLLGAQGLVLYLTTKSEDRTEVTTSKGNTEFQVKVCIAYTIRDVETGQGHTVNFYGVGQDAADKALPKAYTMANKYFLQKFFQVETSEGDAEDDKADKKRATSPEATPAVKFQTAKNLIGNMKDGDRLLEVLEGIKESSIYNKEQKAELSKIISAKLDEIDNPKTT